MLSLENIFYMKYHHRPCYSSAKVMMKALEAGKHKFKDPAALPSRRPCSMFVAQRLHHSVLKLHSNFVGIY